MSEPTLPLSEAWTWWYYNSTIQDPSYVPWDVYTFDDVGSFWSMYNNVKGPKAIPAGASYYLLKEGVKPKLEDNREGGRWIITTKAKERDTKLTKYWLDLLLASIGNIFEDSDDLQGVSVSIRKTGDRFAVWLSSAKSSREILRVGEHLKTILDLEGKIHFYSNRGELEGNHTPLYTI